MVYACKPPENSLCERLKDSTACDFGDPKSQTGNLSLGVWLLSHEWLVPDCRLTAQGPFPGCTNGEPRHNRNPPLSLSIRKSLNPTRASLETSGVNLLGSPTGLCPACLDHGNCCGGGGPFAVSESIVCFEGHVEVG